MNTTSTRESVRVESPDGATTTITIAAAADPAAPVVLCLPAMGIEARFYGPLLDALAKAGLNAAVLELRGLGTSSVRPSRRVDFGYATLAQLDLPAAIRATRARFPSARLHLLGHSLGGQVATLHLAAHPDADVRGLVLVASGIPWHRLWPLPMRLVVRAIAWLFPFVGRLLGHFPGKRLAFAGDEARTVIADWGHLARTGRFAPRGWDGPDPEVALQAVEVPVLGVSLEDDLYTPAPVVDFMIAKMTAAPVERFHYDYRAHGAPPVDHVRWPRHPRVIVERIAAWIAGLDGAGRVAAGGD
ncbi:MAG TPA: alpha/beta fold hydrolase [Vulgatibacter sp.]|nr:alpha/beta fold hydrolase [Vulgatibacter sp.]